MLLRATSKASFVSSAVYICICTSSKVCWVKFAPASASATERGGVNMGAKLSLSRPGNRTPLDFRLYSTLVNNKMETCFCILSRFFLADQQVAELLTGRSPHLNQHKHPLFLLFTTVCGSSTNLTISSRTLSAATSEKTFSKFLATISRRNTERNWTLASFSTSRFLTSSMLSTFPALIRSQIVSP
uniref:Uncharacterized protein n=1 Tax=Triticum urartu TaxID=4572 RepID=A0A8R7P8V0_TRIUA